MKRAFTLIELITVIAIIAILALVLVPNAYGYINVANDTVCVANQRVIETEINNAYLLGNLNEELLVDNDGKVAKNITDIIGFDISSACSKEGEYITYFTDGVLEVRFNHVEDGDLISTEVITNNNPTLTDSSMTEHEITSKHEFDDLKSLFNYGGLILNSGDIISDGEKTYAMYWSSYLREPGNPNYTIEDLYSRNSYNMVEITDDTKILTEDDISVKSTGEQWEEPIKSGTIAYYDGEYYICKSNLNKYTFPPFGWVKINMSNE